MLLKKMQKVHLNEEQSPEITTCKKKLKKLRKLSESLMETTGHEDKVEASTSSKISQKTETKKKKRKKSVSFSETVLEYTVQEPPDNDNPQGSSSSTETVEIHHRNLSDKHDDDPVTTDEGIEQDCDVKTQDCGQECFSEMQHRNRKGKKKKKKKSVEIVEIIEEVAETKKKKRDRKDGHDIDGVGKIKKKKYQHKEVDGIGSTLEDLQISE